MGARRRGGSGTMITREELYRLVWSVSGKVAAAKLGVSDSYLKRVCTALDVPRPELGWWRKREVGRAPAPPPLPAVRPGRPTSWSKGAAGGAWFKPHYRELDLVNDPIVAGVHRLVIHSREILSRADRSLDGAVLLVNRSHRILDLSLSEKSVDAGLRFANALFIELEGRGHRITTAPVDNLIRPPISNWGREPAHVRLPQPDHIPRFPTIVHIHGVPMGLAILEIVEEAEMRYVGGGVYVPASAPPPAAGIHWTEWRRTPTGRLKLAAYSPYRPLPWLREWTEARRGTFASKTKTLALATELELAAAELGTTREMHDRTAAAAAGHARARDSSHRAAQELDGTDRSPPPVQHPLFTLSKPPQGRDTRPSETAMPRLDWSTEARGTTT
ncbi:hypothetical protein ACCS43_33870 [Rhizobium ruizarguesonis]